LDDGEKRQNAEKSKRQKSKDESCKSKGEIEDDERGISNFKLKNGDQVFGFWLILTAGRARPTLLLVRESLLAPSLTGILSHD